MWTACSYDRIRGKRYELFNPKSASWVVQAKTFKFYCKRYLDWLTQLESLKIGSLTLVRPFLLPVFISRVLSVHPIQTSLEQIETDFHIRWVWSGMILGSHYWYKAWTTHDAILGLNNSWRFPRTYNTSITLNIKPRSWSKQVLTIRNVGKLFSRHHKLN